MCDAIPYLKTHQENEEEWLAGWVILEAKYRPGNYFYPWHVTIYNLHTHEINHWDVPDINDTWQYVFWAE